MENKKTHHADIKSKSVLISMLGLVISLSITLVAFEWKSYGPGDMMDLGVAVEDFDEIIEIPPTVHPPKLPPIIKQPQIIEIPNDEEIQEEIEIDFDIDITEETQIEEITFEDDPEEEVAEDMVVFAEVQASFPGGMAKWNEFLNKNLDYPRKAQRMNISGTVFLSFIVDKNGIISDIEVIREVGGGCDEEAVRVLKASPKWNPGLQRGRPVKSRMSIRIAFTLR